MKITNMRLGFATNSSSSHSIIFLPKRHDPGERVMRALAGRQVKDELVSPYDVENGSCDFGWSTFVAASPETKRAYFSIILARALQGSGVPKDLIKPCMQELLGWAPVGDTAGDIDHQSVFDLPYDFSGKFIHTGFVRNFLQMLMDDRTVIVGGNDNGGDDDDRHDVLQGSTPFHLPYQLHAYGYDARDKFVCRSEEGVSDSAVANAGRYTLFHRRTGTKLRVQFGGRDDPATTDGEYKPIAPELVDIKITDYCAMNCKYCYQGSTRDGKHASIEALSSVAHVLGEMQVFEVALGGGEPTDHPKFAQILKMFRDANVVPNFTTRSTKWLKKPKVIEHMGAVAFSVETLGDLKRYAEAIEHARKDHVLDHRTQVVYQYVMGTGNLSHILAHMEKNYIQLTLLGYKNTGRGPLAQVDDRVRGDMAILKKWLLESDEDGERYNAKRIGIDTALAAQIQPELKKAGVPETMYHTREGIYSMYIDAVTMRAGPSSYDPDAMQSLAVPSTDNKVFLPHLGPIIESMFAQWR